MLMHGAILALFLAFLSGVMPLLFVKRFPGLCRYSHFVLFGLSGLTNIVVGLYVLIMHISAVVSFPFGLPFILSSLCLDPLSAFFLCLIGVISLTLAFFGPSYIRYFEGNRRSLAYLVFFTGLFLFSMILVVLAHDLFSFLFAWELMSLTSYFLVNHQYQSSENRRAAFVYLVMAHLSGLFILIAFAVLARYSGGYDFQTFKLAHLPIFWSSVVFLCMLLGFGMKSGLVPLHVWLPLAHPVAPSHISALMSGVMLKIAIYGFIRFGFDLIAPVQWQWGILVLSLGCLSALIGVLFALMQHDLKRLLAYHSVENIGIIFIGLGLSMIFISAGFPVIGALGLIAALYHCLNHALFKSLLFLGAGAISESAHEQDLERMGGLIHKMPRIALFFLVGCVSISALPPFNGFVSEWLTFQTALQASILQSGIMRVVMAISVAALTLSGALAAACFTKVYGVAFLGKPRTKHVCHASRPAIGVEFALGSLALLCLFFGVVPFFALILINSIPTSLFGFGLSATSVHNWLWIAPISLSVSSYSGVSVVCGLIIGCFFTYLIFKRFQRSCSYKQLSAWDCGFGGLKSSMQYSATAFAMPIRRVFKNVWKTEEKLEAIDCQDKPDQLETSQAHYHLQVDDHIWHVFYLRIDEIVQKIAKLMSRLQSGNVRVYLAYMFFTLLLLLLVI